MKGNAKYGLQDQDLKVKFTDGDQEPYELGGREVGRVQAE